MGFMDDLTLRQREVVLLLVEGHNLESVANQLNITRFTAAKHMKDMHDRIGEGTIQGLVVKYYKTYWEPKHEETGSPTN